LGMVEHAAHLNTLTQDCHPAARLEGAIWNPARVVYRAPDTSMNGQ
jgi:hypothetical protein